MQGSFSALLTQYHTTNRHAVGEVMHYVFSSPRGAPSPFNSDKIDAIHELLQLKEREALLDQRHPVCMELDADPGGWIKRSFVAGPKMRALPQVFGRNLPTHSAHFLTALGKPVQQFLLLYRFSSSA
jgi:hypothetical protein